MQQRAESRSLGLHGRPEANGLGCLEETATFVCKLLGELGPRKLGFARVWVCAQSYNPASHRRRLLHLAHTGALPTATKTRSYVPRWIGALALPRFLRSAVRCAPYPQLPQAKRTSRTLDRP